MAAGDLEEVRGGPSRRLWPPTEEFRYSQCGEKPLGSLTRQSWLTFCTFGCWAENGFWGERRETGLAMVQMREFVVARASVVARGVDRFRVCVQAELIRCEV